MTTTLALGCYEDNELRALARFSDSAAVFCPTFTLTPTGTLPDYISVFPTPSVESACACFLGATRKSQMLNAGTSSALLAGNGVLLLRVLVRLEHEMANAIVDGHKH